MKKLLKISGLGIVIWSLGLVWPEVNRVLSPAVMLGLVAGLALTSLLYLAGRQPDRPLPGGKPEPNCSSRPVPLVR